MNQADKTPPQFRLKRPVIVFSLAVAFLIATPSNLAMALFRRGIENWFLPNNWWQLFNNLPWYQTALLALLPISGVLLFIQKKTTWFLAIVTLILVSLQNLFLYFGQGETGLSLVLLTVVNLSGVVVFYFFRFPYLDQRDHIFKGVAERHETSIKVTVKDSDQPAWIKNISETGCFVQFSPFAKLPVLHATIELRVESYNLTCEVAHLRGHGCGLKFLSPSVLSKKIVLELLGKAKSAKREVA